MSIDLPDPTGTDWTQAEIDLIVADYFDMLRLEIAGKPYVKSHRNAALQELTRRASGSIERKHQNISAVLSRLGRRWIKGYKPLPNFQAALLRSVEQYLVEQGDPELPSQNELADIPAHRPLEIVAPPAPDGREQTEPEAWKRMVRKFDPASRDARNRALGKRGEENILIHERERLTQMGRADLASQVRWVSDIDGDGAGYDILSFNTHGAERLLEVKTTNGAERTPFYLSENERQLSLERPDAFRIVRLYDFFIAPKAFRLRPPLDRVVSMKPANYKVSLL